MLKNFHWTARFFLLVLFTVTVGFGILKQTKTALRSWEALTEPKEEPGATALFFKKWLYKRYSVAEIRKLGIGYVTDREEGNSTRPVGQYRYDAQYGMAPLILSQTDSQTGYFLLDFSDEERERSYCVKNGLQLVDYKGTMALAVRKS